MSKSNPNDPNVEVNPDATLSSSTQLDTGTGGFTLDDGKLYTYDVGANDPAETGGVKGNWSGGSVAVENDDTKDISPGTKKTLADYLGKITKSSRVYYQGNSPEESIYKDYGKGNAFPVATETNEEQKTFTGKQNPASGTKWSYSSSDILTETSAAPTDDPNTKLREKASPSSPGFSPGNRTSEVGSDTVGGHQLLRDANNANSPVAKYSKALINNRFTSESTYNSGLTTPQFLTTYKMGVSATKEEINKDGVSFGRLAKVGGVLTTKASAELGSSGDGYNPAGISELTAILPGLSQLGVTRVEAFALEARTVLDSLNDDDITEYDLINPNEKSWGSLNNVLEKYSGLGNAGMSVLAFALVLAMSIGIVLFMFLINLGNKFISSRGTSTVDTIYESTTSGRRPFGREIRRSDAQAMTSLGFVPTKNDFQKCVEQGALAFYGIEYKKFGLVASVFQDLGDFAFNPSVGWMSIMTRVVVRSFIAIVDLVSDIVKMFAAGNFVSGGLALISLFDSIRSSKVMKCINTFAQLGDKVLTVISLDIEDEAASSQGGGKKYSAIDKSAKIMGNLQDAHSANRLFGNSTTLAWSAHRAPDLFILPTSFKRSLAEAESLGAPSVYPTSKTLKYESPYYEAKDEKNSRIDTVTREKMESLLEAEYLPFYFHDVRTNEIISFHAFLTSLTDDYTASYDSADAFGRVESIKTYKNTARKIGLSFMLAATNPADLDSMWLKINKLTTMVYPQFNQGKTIVGTAGGKNYTMTAPFSQQMIGSPMIRLRVGDLIQSNYSKFGLARLFGYGNSGTKFNGKELQPPAQSVEDQTKAYWNRFEAAKTDSTYEWWISELTPLPNPVTSDGKFIKLNEYDVKNTFVAVFSEKKDDANIYYLVEKNKANSIKIQKEAREILADKTKYKISIKPEHLLDLTRQSHEKLMKETKAPSDYDIEMLSMMSDDPNQGNAIAKSFRSAGGRGLAGFVESLGFDWYDKVTWANLDQPGAGDRIPKMCKVTISFSPIHDITPGLDHTGMNRAPIYPVGAFRPKRIVPDTPQPADPLKERQVR